MITLIENNNVTGELVESIYTPNQAYFDDYTSNMGMEDNSQVLDALKWKLTEDQGHGIEKVLSILDDGVIVGLIEGLIDGSTIHTSINFSRIPFADYAEQFHTYLQSININKIIAWAKPDTVDDIALKNALNKPELYTVVTSELSTFPISEDNIIEHSLITLNLI
tara:strand:- start:568 stop:1062 length:495 start_codon:yes stop_codon:yes gene_type:complete